MKHLILKPNGLFMISALLIGLWGLLTNYINGNSAINIQLYDTYYIIIVKYLFLTITGALMGFAACYTLPPLIRVETLLWLTWLHVVFTLQFFFLAVYFFFPFILLLAFPRRMYYSFTIPEEHWPYLYFSFFLFLVGQIIFVVHLFLWVSQLIHRKLKP